ncbi:MAG TPA: hypothetical protein VF278_18300 [Pirellulales bacterium]
MPSRAGHGIEAAGAQTAPVTVFAAAPPPLAQSIKPFKFRLHCFDK